MSLPSNQTLMLKTCSTTSNINATNLSYALWNSSGTIKLHLAKNRSTSSVYAPNENYLKYFPDHIGVQPRMTELLIENTFYFN